MIRVNSLEYEPIEIKDVHSGNLEGKLVTVTGTPKGGSPIRTSDSRLRYFRGVLNNGEDAINLETAWYGVNPGVFGFNLVVGWGCKSITVGGMIKRSDESPNEYVLVPHFLYGKSKEGEEEIVNFTPII